MFLTGAMSAADNLSTGCSTPSNAAAHTSDASMTTRGSLASDRLTRRLINLAQLGIRPRCSEPTHGYWTSEHEPERRLAAVWCRGCPVLVECGEAAVANDERWGVWAGVDRSVRPGKRLQRMSKAA
jgi:hypothetical protein